MHIRSKITLENMKSDKNMELRSKRYKRQVIKTKIKETLENNKAKEYIILCAMKITLHGWSQTACSKLALVLL